MQRVTRQRTVIAKLLESTDNFKSAQQLHELLRQQGDTTGLATVYRTLQNLAEKGQVDVLRNAEGETLYRSCAKQEHHHHLVCSSCGKTIEIDGPNVEKWAENIGAQHGFKKIEHTVEIFGICSECQL